MDSQLINEPPDISYLIRNIPITEITSTLQFLHKKTSQDLHNKILDINKLLSNINNAKNEMNDYELMYLYLGIRSLSTTLKTSEDNVLLKLKNIKNEYRCNKCKKKIKICHGWSLLDNLQNHACDQLIMPLGDRSGYNILRLKEYNLYKAIHYDYSIKEELFFKKIATNGKQVYLYTIYVFDDCFVCLVCECDISGTNNVLQHIFGQRHLQNLNTQYEIVKIFHSNFAKMESEHQLLQKEFALVDALKVECDRCTRKILYTNLLNHLKNGKCFKDKIETTATQAATIYNKTSFSEPSSPAQSSVLDNVQCNLVKYDNLIKKTIYKDLLEWYMVIDNVRYPILQNIENKVYCLVCSTYISRSISAHIDSGQHIMSLTENNMRSIQKYHRIWSVQPVNVQIEQVHFRRRENKITCTACSDFMSYNSQILLNHVESPSHKMFMMRKTGTSRSISVESRTHMNNQSSGSVSSRSTSVEAEGCTSSVSSTSSTANKTTATQAATTYNKTSFSEPSSPAQSSVLGKIKIAPYDKTVFDELYPDGLMHFTVSIGPIKYPTIIKRGIYKHCFICNIDIPTAVLLHANSSQHEESLISEHRRDLLKKFHNLWLDLPSTDQCRQVLFNVNDNLTCMLCNKGLAYDIKELKSHLDSWEHVQNVMSTYYDKSPTKKQDTNNLDGILATDDSVVNLATTGNQAKSPNENVKNTSIKSPEKVNKLKTELRQDLLIDLEPNTTIENEDTNSKATLNTPDKTKGNPGIKLGSIIYSKQTINELYGEELIHYSIRIDNVKYPFIQNMGNYKRCIICNIDIISSVLFHINSTPHIDSSNDSKKMDQLKRYHELWLNFPESDQLEQKYFEIGEKLTCAPCQKELNYDFEILNSHIFSIGHGNQVWTLNKPSSKPLVLTENGEIAEEVDELTDEENLLSSLSEEEITSADNDNSSAAQLSSESEFLNKSYDQIILDTVYLNLSQYRLKENDQELFYLQNRDGAIYCLLCENKFTDIAEHIAQTSHLSRCKDLVISGRLKCFHEIFLQLPTLYQKQQIYFKPKTHMITCLLCGTNCYSCEDVVEHLVKKGHTKILKNRKKILRRNAAREVYNKEPLNNTYDQTVLDTIYLNLTQYTVTKNNESLLYLQNRNGTVYCLMCRGTLTNITEHVVQISHVSRSEDLNILGMIKHFHEVFLKLPPSLQLEQIYFKPKKKRLTCIKCSVSYNFADIGAHLASKIHRRLLNGSGTNLAKSIVDSVDDSCCINQELPIKSYDQTVLDTVYLNLTQYTLMEGKQSLLYLQNRNGTIYCLICRKELTNITKHLAEVHHLLKSKSPANLEMTKHFHKIFSQLPPVFQKEQIYFRPKYGSHTCLLCGDLNFSQYDDIEQHLLSVRHRKLTMKDANKLSRYEADIFYDDRSVNKVIKTPEGNIVKETENYQFSQETNCVNYDIFSAMPPDDCTSSPAAEIVKTKNIQKPLAQETNTRVVNIFESLDSNNYFSQESNCVKYYVYSTILSGTSNLPAATKSSTNKRQFREKANNSTCAVISPDCDAHMNTVQTESWISIVNNKYYCLYCRVKCHNGIDDHIKNPKHNRRLRFKIKEIDEYLLQLKKLGLPYNEVPIDFIPSTLLLTFCMKCGIHVEYCKLKDHLDQFHKDAEYSLKDKLKDDFPQLPGPYSQKALQTYFEHSPPQCNIIVRENSYPVMQSSYQCLYCLVCKVKVTEGDALDHLASKYHINLVCDDKITKNVVRYHKFLAELNSIYWNHIPFINNKSNLFYCTICDKRVAKKGLQKHLEWVRHRNTLSSMNYSDCGTSNDVPLTEIEEEPPRKIPDAEVLAGMYPQKINEEVRKMNCLNVDIIQASPNNKFTCMICLVEVDKPTKHALEVYHQARLQDLTTYIEPVRSFHQVWNYMDDEFKVLQNLFFPIAPTVTFCTTCCFNLNYSYLLAHLKQCHSGMDVELQEKLNTVFIFVSKKEYFPKVRNILYKDNVPQCDLILESTSYPVIQTYNTMRCLLCYKEVLDNKYIHLSSSEHKANMLSITIKRRLKRYHDIWLDGDEDFQMQQIYFERDGPSLYCKVCLADLSTSDLREHIRSDSHNSSLKTFVINERISGNAVFQDIEIMPQLDNDKDKVELMQVDECYTDSESDEDSEAVMKHYNKAVLEEFYPDFNNHHLTLDNIRYPIFRKTVVGFKCMICKRNPDVTDINQHLILESHKTKIVDRTAQNKFKKFHDFWLRHETSIQMHQKYFHRMKCIPCDVQVEYEAIATHVQTQEHEKNISLPFLKNENEDCSVKSLKPVTVPSSVSYSPSTSAAFKNQDSNREGSPLKEAVKNKEKLISVSKAGSSKKSGHKIKKSVQNSKDPIIINQIPLRYAEHKKFLIMDKNDNIFCKCCSKKLKLNIPSIKEHLDSVQHCTVANVNKLKIKYYCEVCVKHYSMESSWDNHLVDLTHIARYNNLGKDRREHMIEYECLTCKLVIFGDQISLKRHITGVPRKKAKEITLPQSIVHLLASQNSIIQNSEKLLLEANIASQSQDKEKQVCTALVKVIKEIYPMCKAYPFGSRVTGLGYCDSDLDVFLDIGDMYHGNQNQHPEDQAQIVKKVAKILQKHRNTFSDINKVAAARTPIVQVFHKDSEVDCDISFRHGLSVENTAFISLCLDLQPIMRPTMLYLKEWFAATNLSGLSSYALTMLMVFYFQTKGYLLSIKELRHINPESSNIIDGWETIKYSVSLQTMKEYVNKCEYTVIQLMKNFFEYYATFDFEKWVICPLMGYLISKGHFNGYGTSLPVEMSRYVTKLYCTKPEYFRNLTPMCVQDPFDLSHNLTKACSKDMVRKFQAYCDLSKKHISAFN